MKPWTVRLYPESHSSLFVRVHVWPTKRTFLDHLNRHHITRWGNRFGGRTQGACARYNVHRIRQGRRQKSRCVAEVNLWRGRLGMEIVTHELFHATMAWACRVRFPFHVLGASPNVTRDEERITYAHGQLCAQFVRRGYRPGGVYCDSDTVVSQ